MSWDPSCSMEVCDYSPLPLSLHLWIYNKPLSKAHSTWSMYFILQVHKRSPNSGSREALVASTFPGTLAPPPSKASSPKTKKNCVTLKNNLLFPHQQDGPWCRSGNTLPSLEISQFILWTDGAILLCNYQLEKNFLSGYHYSSDHIQIKVVFSCDFTF